MKSKWSWLRSIEEHFLKTASYGDASSPPNSAWKKVDQELQSPRASQLYRGFESLPEACRSKRRGLELRGPDHPIESMFFELAQGRYPPPEVLLTVLDQWERYLAAAGTLSMEEAFAGKPSRRTGTLAARRAKAMRMPFRIYALLRMKEGGLSRREATEALGELEGVDPETIERQIKGLWPRDGNNGTD